MTKKPKANLWVLNKEIVPKVGIANAIPLGVVTTSCMIMKG